MRRMSSDELRENFLRFFESKNHLRVAGANIVPVNDPSLLLIGAGMAPFKAYFTGAATPPSGRVTSVQRCVRTPDIERVGQTGRHGTSFEMLGNFSFGDYFKHDAIHWAWEYLTEVLELPIDKLYITVHRDDEEALQIWRDEIKVPVERILRLGDEDNFWEIGVGPCGPDSEIFIDRGPEFGCGKPDCAMGCDCDRYLEIWNLVFTQYDKDENGKLTPLTRRCIDTGLGLDRVAMVLQEVRSLTEIDLNKPLLDHLLERTGVVYDGKSSESISLRVIADHLKGVVLLIGDGVLPGNEGRSYVLRRLLRRAVRVGRLLGLKEPFMAEAAAKLVKTYGVGYPELVVKQEFLLRVIDTEERRFLETLEAGLQLVGAHLEQLRREAIKLLDGEVAFKLHDTFGFPLELTQELLRENGFDLDIEGFRAAMQRQRERARAARGEIDAMGVVRAGFAELLSRFAGYEELTMEAKVLALWQQDEQVSEAQPHTKIEVVFDQTPFYAESGGQIGDTGLLEHGEERLEIANTVKESSAVVHHLHLGERSLRVGDIVRVSVNRERREAIARHHTATHLLHYALRQVLGEHAQQAGSLVTENRLRFDFNHFEALKPEELDQIETIVNRMILSDLPSMITEMGLEEARASGVTALFGEKYGDRVRVVRLGDSVELCGGCHVRRSGEIGLFHILSETSIGAGLRRIEAVAGLEVLRMVREQESLLEQTGKILKAKNTDLVEKATALQQHVRVLEREIEALNAAAVVRTTDTLLQQVREIAGVKLLAAEINGGNAENLRQLADVLRDRMGSGVVFLAALGDERVDLLVAATKDLAGKVHAGNLVRELAKLVDGRGGGRPDLAQAGGTAPQKLPEALAQVEMLLREQLQ